MVKIYRFRFLGAFLASAFFATSVMAALPAPIKPLSGSRTARQLAGLEELTLTHIRELAESDNPHAHSALAVLQQLMERDAMSPAENIVRNPDFAQELRLLQRLGLVTSVYQVTDVVQNAFNTFTSIGLSLGRHQSTMDSCLACWSSFATSAKACWKEEGRAVVGGLKQIVSVLLKLYAGEVHLDNWEQNIVSGLDFAVNQQGQGNNISVPLELVDIMNGRGELHRDAHQIIAPLARRITRQITFRDSPAGKQHHQSQLPVRGWSNLWPPPPLTRSLAIDLDNVHLGTADTSTATTPQYSPTDSIQGEYNQDVEERKEQQAPASAHQYAASIHQYAAKKHPHK